MYLAPEGEELEIASAAADFIAHALPIQRLHQSGDADMGQSLRKQVGDMGWFALALSQAQGGSGLSAVEHALFFREIGRQCGPVDILAQALAANAAQSAKLRGALVSGEAGVALLVTDGPGYRLLGSPQAEYAILAGPEGASLHRMDAAQLDVRAGLASANTLASLGQLPEQVDAAQGARIWQLGQIGSASILIGLAEAALDLIVEYAKIRETFGRPIGSYQAVRHTCANMAVQIEAARAQLWFAAAALKEERGDAAAHIDAAKHLANETAQQCTDDTIQLHGGIGVTDEHDAHLLMKHAVLYSRLFGTRRQLLAGLLHARLED